MIKTGVGMSEEKDAFRAGSEAAGKALAEAGGKADLAVVFATSKYDQQKLMDGLVKALGNTPMCGGTTAGEISNTGFSEGSVVVMALKSGKVRFATGLGKGIPQGEAKAGRELVENAMKKAKGMKGAKALVMFNDSMAGDGLEVIKGAQSVLGEDFEIVGGALGDDAAFKETWQYYDGRVYQGTVTGFMVFGSIHSTTGVMSGWTSMGNRMKATAAKGNVLLELDGKPALDVYASMLGPERAKKLPAIGLEYPFGLIDDKAVIKGKEYFQLRCPLAVDWAKKSVTLAASVPIGKEVTLTIASREDVIEGAKLSAAQAKAGIGKRKPAAIFMFSCVARKMVLGERVGEEISAVRRALGPGVPIIGFYTYGEIGPIDKTVDELKQTKWHNETVVLWVLAE